MNEHLGQAPLELSSSQKEVAQQVVTAFETDGKQIVIVEGFSGTGKTTLADHIQSTNPALGIEIATEDDLRWRFDETFGSHNKILITRKPPKSMFDSTKEQEDRATNECGFSIHLIPLKGMTLGEMETFLQREFVAQPGSLSTPEIVELSLGIPALAKILSYNGLTREMAVSISAGYLSQNIGRDTKVDSYLAMPVSKEVWENTRQVRGYSKTGIYDDLAYAMQKRLELHEKGIHQEAPLFVAPESEAMYNEMLRQSGRTGIDIYAPDLTDEDFEEITRVLGVEVVEGYNRDESRSQMFPSEWRKVSVWQKSDRDTLHVDHEYYGIEKGANNFASAHAEGRLGLPLHHNPGENVFFIHSHAHSGEPNPTRIGYMTETLLQQRGISYFVSNATLDRSYWFNAQTGHIVPLEEYLHITATRDGSRDRY
jgi:hypothetical protein